MIRRRRNVLRAAAVTGALVGASLLMPAPAAHASAWDCHTQALSNQGARGWCNQFSNGTRIRIVVECERGGGAFYKTVYGPWRNIPGAHSNAYCPVNYYRYHHWLQYG